MITDSIKLFLPDTPLAAPSAAGGGTPWSPKPSGGVTGYTGPPATPGDRGGKRGEASEPATWVDEPGLPGHTFTRACGGRFTPKSPEGDLLNGADKLSGL